jgi:hypothetical protein
MNWYVYSSGLDTDNPPKLTTEQVIALINDNTIGKNAQIMQANGGTEKWIKITRNPDFAEALKSLKERKSKKKTSKKIQIKEPDQQEPDQQQPAQQPAQQPLPQQPLPQQPLPQQPMQQHPMQQHPMQQQPMQQHPVQQQQSTAKRRTVKYHNLERYLGFMTTFINVIVILCGFCSLVGHSVIIYSSVALISQEWDPNGFLSLSRLEQLQDDAQRTLFIAFFSLIISTALLLFIRMCLLAGVELIKVIVDIEKNTR